MKLLADMGISTELSLSSKAWGTMLYTFRSKD
jgi:hypothetical protein